MAGYLEISWSCKMQLCLLLNSQQTMTVLWPMDHLLVQWLRGTANMSKIGKFPATPNTRRQQWFLIFFCWCACICQLGSTGWERIEFKNGSIQFSLESISKKHNPFPGSFNDKVQTNQPLATRSATNLCVWHQLWRLLRYTCMWFHVPPICHQVPCWSQQSELYA